MTAFFSKINKCVNRTYYASIKNRFFGNKSELFKIIVDSSEHGSFKDLTPGNQERYWSVSVFINPRSIFMHRDNFCSFQSIGESELQEALVNERS